ncbi:uncharacterized protein LOC124898566 [Capsicum annuum]|uniref:uncharacterized protein LOC124898566 n=1 Tax=Capsicum annuum TaxID=4072 RepID=UPI001FB0F5EB|nr:uncharacterized protein LOC124898566 [Capsicum annuum]
MARSRGRGSTGRGGKSAVKSNNDVTANVPTISTPAIVTSQADVIGGQNNTNQVQPLIPQIRSMVQTSDDDMNRGRGTGRGSIGCAGKSAARTNMPVRIANMPTIPTHTVAPQTAGGIGAPTSNHDSMSPSTPNQTNPTTKHVYWDSSITDAAVKKHWQSKVATSRRGGKEVAAGTHKEGSISIGEYRKRLERFEEILREKILSESVIDQIEAYSQAAGGEKKRRVFGLGSESKGYYGQTLCISCGKTSSSASHESVPAADSNLNEFVKRLIPALKNQFFPIVIAEVQKLVSSRSVFTPPTTPLDDLDSLNDDCNDLDQL